MVYKIFKKNNYIIVIDENNNYFEEHCSQVLVIKKYTTDTVYDIIFIRPESVPQAFYAVTFANIRDEFNAPYASVAAWETWYTTNTGCQGAAGTSSTLASILATLQAQSEVEGVFVKDTGNSDKVVLQVRVWDQDSQTFINTLYFNPDGTPYSPVIGPVEWVGTSGSTNSIITGPLGNTTTCANSVAVTLCNALYTEFFDQGDLLDTINTSLDNIETDVDALLTAFNNEDFATQTTLAAVLTELQGTIDVNVTNSTIAVTQSGAWTVTANQGINPWIVSGTVNIGTMPAITGTVALDATTLNALENITVSGTVAATQSGAWSVSVLNFPATQNVAVTSIVEVEVKNDVGNPLPVSGTVTITPSGTQNVNIVSTVPVPVTDNGGSLTVDATDLDIRNLTFATDKVDVSGSTVKLQDGSGNGITSTVVGLDTALDVNIVGGVTLDVALSRLNDSVQIYGSDTATPVATDTSGHLQVDVLTIPAITGSVTVSATDLDIRDLAFTTDSVTSHQGGTWNINNISGTISLPTNAAKESTLSGISIAIQPQGRTHNTIVATTGPTAIGTVPANSLRGSVLNVGSAAGTWNGISLPAGVGIPWEPVGNRDTYGAIAYDATGTTFIIEYTT